MQRLPLNALLEPHLVVGLPFAHPVRQATTRTSQVRRLAMCAQQSICALMPLVRRRVLLGILQAEETKAVLSALPATLGIMAASLVRPASCAHRL